nr:C1 family peptidase [uncultured Methanoregula sp.]
MQQHPLTRTLTIILFCMVLLIHILPLGAADSSDDAYMDDLSYADLEEEYLTYENVTIYDATSTIAVAPTNLTNNFPKTSYAEWNQGQCGNCWVWAGTGVLAQTLNKSKNTYTPLSIQFFNSNYMDGNINMKKPHDWACTGGFPSTFAEIYNTGVNQSYEGGPFAVPWSNYNASYKDASVGSNGNVQTTLPKNLMTIRPNYGIDHIDAQKVLATPSSNQTAAVENITLALVDGKVIFYSMYLPNKTAWDEFDPEFWGKQPDGIWDMDRWNATDYNSSAGEGSGHAMILIGYNKTDPAPANQYWIVQNSWGNPVNRSTGQYKLKMWMDYNATFNNTGWYTQEFWVFNTSWKTDPTVSSITPSTGRNTGSVEITALEGTNFASGAELMLKSASVTPRHVGSIANGANGALLENPYKAAVRNNYAYIASYNSSALEIVNLSNPFVPEHVGRIVNGTGGALLDGPTDVAVSGNYAYVTSYNNNALEIVDISTPSAPFHRGKIVNGTGGAKLQEPMSVKVVGNYAYVTSAGSNSLEIVDVSNPSLPVHKANVTDGVQGAPLYYPVSVDIVPGYPYAYVTSLGSNALTIIDISNLSEPAWESAIYNGGGGGALLDGPRSVRVAGYNAYIASNASNALEIIDISNQSAPFHRGSIAKTAGVTYLNGPADVAISADRKYAYVTSYQGGTFDVIDISNPSAPVYQTGITNGAGGALLKNPNGVVLSRSLAYVTSRGSDALEVVALDAIPATDITVASASIMSGSFDLTGAPAGSWSVVATNSNGRYSSLDNGFTITAVPQPVPTLGPDSGGDSKPAGTGKTSATAGQASVSLKTNSLGQTLAPYTVQTTAASPIEVTVAIPQATKSLTAAGAPISEVTVTPVSKEAVAGLTLGTAAPEGTVFATGGLGVECSPAGASFSQPVAITFTMTEAQWNAALAQAGGRTQDITVQYYDTTSKSWLSLPTTVAPATHQVTATTTHFTLFAVFVKTADTAGAAPSRVTYSWETPTPAALIQTTTAAVTRQTPVPAPAPSQPQFPAMTIVAIIAGIAVIIAGVLLLRRWWIRRQNPALFRKYD